MQRKPKKELDDCQCYYTGFHPRFGVIGKKKAMADKPIAPASGGGEVTRAKVKASRTENPKPTLEPKAKPAAKTAAKPPAKPRAKPTTRSKSKPAS